MQLIKLGVNVGKNLIVFIDSHGFKHVFGREANKDVLIAFLNEIIPNRVIVDLDHLRNEQIPENRKWKKSVYDLYCRTNDGSRIVVELQSQEQADYIDRALYYGTFPIQSQVEKGDKEYTICPVYVVNIMNFCLPELIEQKQVLTYFRFGSDTGVWLEDKLTLVFIELPKFEKTPDELDKDSVLDGFYYCLKHINSLSERPPQLQQKIMERLFEVAQVAAMTQEEQQEYIQTMKTERDIRNYISFAHKKGKEEGRAEGVEEGRAKESALIAKKLREKGVPVEIISSSTGLTEEQVMAL